MEAATGCDSCLVRSGVRREARRAPVAVLIGHLVALLLLVAFLIGQHHRPPAPVVYTPPAGAAYAHEAVRISLSCGDVLAGSLTLRGGRQHKAPASPRSIAPVFMVMRMGWRLGWTRSDSARPNVSLTGRPACLPQEAERHD